ncbi:unnamed protein product [Rangifer tarandus platyrhynchus]|uniref:Uncharacterized protein n=1 Tax=Rangifer tarandus platyrhynchus TaxID=3082113 RepID=A0AC60A1U4_RANTA
MQPSPKARAPPRQSRSRAGAAGAGEGPPVVTCDRPRAPGSSRPHRGAAAALDSRGPRRRAAPSPGRAAADRGRNPAPARRPPGSAAPRARARRVLARAARLQPHVRPRAGRAAAAAGAGKPGGVSDPRPGRREESRGARGTRGRRVFACAAPASGTGRSPVPAVSPAALETVYRLIPAGSGGTRRTGNWSSGATQCPCQPYTFHTYQRLTPRDTWRSEVSPAPALKVHGSSGTPEVSDARWPVGERLAILSGPADKRGGSSQPSCTPGKVTSQFCLWHSTSSSPPPKGNVTSLMMGPKPPKYQPAASAVISFLCWGNLQPLEAKPPHRTPSARPLLETESAKYSMTWAPPAAADVEWDGAECRSHRSGGSHQGTMQRLWGPWQVHQQTPLQRDRRLRRTLRHCVAGPASSPPGECWGPPAKLGINALSDQTG